MNELQVVIGKGPLGLAVAHNARERGFPVRVVSRTARPAPEPGIDMLAGDIRDREFAAHALRGAAVVYQCAQPAYTRWVQEFPALQAAIVDATAAAGARLVIGDNLYAYGLVAGPIREDTPERPNSRKGLVRAEMARQALAAHQQGRLQVAIGRGADFFGPQVLDSVLGERAIGGLLKDGKASLIGSLDLPHTFTYIEDFGRALVTLGQDERGLGRAWHVPNPPTLTQRQVMQRFADAAGMPLNVSSMGALMLRLGGLFIPEARETVEMLYEFEHPFLVDSSPFETTFGETATDWDTATERTLDWYRSHRAAAEPVAAGLSR